MARGLSVVAVDPSASMLAVLSANHPALTVVRASAEDTGLPDRSFDSIFVAQAWHWIDPVAASAEAARLLRPGGYLTMIWNRRVLEGWQAEFDALQEGVRGIDLVDEHDSAARPPFGNRREVTVFWQREVPADDFLLSYTTHSPFLLADPAEQARRMGAWRTLLAANAGDAVTEHYASVAWRFQLPEGDRDA
ncbi:class I SAM-dependent methyltransferase [Tessaracoccus sp. HDW20]|uniref:class I SAM-dependent methyltransferase n=1 Tax=Tessaracoccus coleopterorum TaxID=2714950 RepID=UPI0018D45195|nr:class I SAM-dependent methyltransferase [Tessaracoccus coleopterorum]